MRQIRMLAVALACAAAPVPLAGQAVLDDPKLDSVQVLLQHALYRLRDTLTLVDAATARIARDIATSSDQVLHSRARIVVARCEAAARTVPPTRTVINANPRPIPDRRKLREQLDRALGVLETEMRKCVDEFTRLGAPENIAELRGYGVGRGTRVRQAARTYQPAVESYFKDALGLRYLPNTAGAVPATSASNRPTP